MSDAPNAKPLTGTQAEKQQPTEEWKIKRRKELIEGLPKELGVRAPIYLLQMVDPGSFVKSSVTIPKQGTPEWDAVRKAVNSGPMIDMLLARLGFLSNLPGGGKLIKSQIPFDYVKDKEGKTAYSQSRTDAIRTARRKIDEHKRTAQGLSPEAAAEVVAFSDAQLEALEDLIKRQDAAQAEGKKNVITATKYQFIDEDVVAGMQKLQAKGYDVSYAAALQAFLEGDFNGEVVPALKDISGFIRTPIEQATEHVDGIPQDKLKLVKEFATYILDRVGEDHDTENQQWQSQLARSVVIFWSYGLAKGELVESNDGSVKKAKIEKADFAGERFLQFVYAYMTNNDPSIFPDGAVFKNIMRGIERDRMPRLINPVHLLVGQLKMSKKIPTKISDVQDLRDNDAKRVTERADRLSKERELLERFQKDTSISFATGLQNYIALRREYERSYEPSKLSIIPPILSAISGVPTAQDIQAMQKIVEANASNLPSRVRSLYMVQPEKAGGQHRRKEFVGLTLEGSKIKAMVAFAQQQGISPQHKRFAFAAARIMYHETQEKLKAELRDIRRHKGDLTNSPVLHALAERAEVELTKAKDALSVQANAINAFFKDFSVMVLGDWRDPKDVGYKLVKFEKGASPTQGVDKKVDNKKSREGRKGHIATLAKDLLKRTNFEAEVQREAKDKLTHLIKALRGEKDKDGKLFSPLHAINMLEAIASAIGERAKKEKVSDGVTKLAQALLLFANPLAQTHAEFKENGAKVKASLPDDSNGLLTVDTLQQITNSI